MKILHINVAGIVDRFYSSMFNALNKLQNIKQEVYVPYKDGEYNEEDFKELNKYDDSIQLTLRPIKNKSDRVLYNKKIKKYFKDIEENVDLSDFELIHAHSLLSDGGVAYKIKEMYGIPYIVAVRTTDTDIFLKYFIHLRKFAKNILENSDAIVFISPSIKNELLNRLDDIHVKKLVEKKSYIIPNGMNEFWLENKISKYELSKSRIRLLQVGRLIKSKNTDKSIYALRNLIDKGFDVELNIVGRGPELENLKRITNKLNVKDRVIFHGFINDKNILLKLYRKCDVFVLPSYSETFGIAYVEAMSQGLPIIGVKESGIDGYFKDGYIGFFIDEAEGNEISEAVCKILSDYNRISLNCSSECDRFDWNDIKETYNYIYRKSIN